MAEITEKVNLYESTRQAVCFGSTYHPGGLSLTRHALELISLPVGARILDLGCGTANSCALLSQDGFQVVGMDLSAQLLRSSENPEQNLVCGDAADIPFAHASFDVILAECTLSQFHPLTLILSQIYDLLSEDGLLILSDLQSKNSLEKEKLRPLFPNSCLVNAFDAEEFSILLAENHFCLQNWEDHPELLRSMIQPDLFPLLTGDPEAQVDNFSLVLSIARARLSYFVCVAKKMSHSPSKKLAGMFNHEHLRWRKEWTILK